MASGRQKIPQPSKPPARIGPEARTEAMRLLGMGCSVSYVAREVGVSRPTIREWRESPDGAKQLAGFRRAHRHEFDKAVDEWFPAMRSLGMRAIEVLGDKLSSKNPFVALAAAREILSRGGMPAATKVEASLSAVHEVTKFSDEELAQFKALLTKAAGGEGT